MYPVKTALIVSSDNGLLLVACATSCIGLTCDCRAVSIKYRRFLQYFFRGRLLVAMFHFRGVPSIHLRNLIPVMRSMAICMMIRTKTNIVGMVISGLLVRERDRLRLVRDFYQNR